jgi:predicted DNA-binding protein (UPF0251 family)
MMLKCPCCGAPMHAYVKPLARYQQAAAMRAMAIPVKEIAARMGVSMSTVWALLRYAKAKAAKA